LMLGNLDSFSVSPIVNWTFANLDLEYVSIEENFFSPVKS
jgi:hypothetical protein